MERKGGDERLSCESLLSRIKGMDILVVLFWRYRQMKEEGKSVIQYKQT